MNRKLFLTTLATLSLASIPVFAQPGGYGSDTKRPGRGRAAPAPIPSVTSYAPHAAKAGTSVTIRGANFMPGTTVLLGNTAIVPTQVSRRAIKFVVPRGASDGAVALDLPNARRHLAVGLFDVVTPPPQTRRYNNDAGYRNTRGNRRAKSRRGVLTRWNNWAFLRSPAAKAELELHAKRLARLGRIKRLAQSQARLVTRVGRAIKRENARHAAEMKKLEKRFIATQGLHAYGAR